MGYMMNNKPKILFPFVEAGMGHIMPMNAIADAFEKKYGNKVDIVRTYFFQDTHNLQLKKIEDDMVNEVKLHNKHKWRAAIQLMCIKTCGFKLSMKYLFKNRYGKGYNAAMNYLSSFNADLIVNTHFSTLYYACEARRKGLISPNTQIAFYCPDPVIGRQWDNRADMVALSSHVGERYAIKSGRFLPSQIKVVPFMIREKVMDMIQSKQFYRNQLGLPQNKFTILLADGAYGAGKLKQTVYKLLSLTQEVSIIAVCGKNQPLFCELSKIVAPVNINLKIFGFTDKMLELSASCDLFVGKAGASNLAEPAYFGAPSIITMRASPIEKWIAQHYVKHIGCSVIKENVNLAVKLIKQWLNNYKLMQPYAKATQSQHRADGAEIFADMLFKHLTTQQEKCTVINLKDFTTSLNYFKEGRLDEI